MKILIIASTVVAVFVLALFIWNKINDALLEAEIERIKIPDDTFDHEKEISGTKPDSGSSKS